MVRLIVVIVASFISGNVVAQIQRTPVINIDSSGATVAKSWNKEKSGKQAFKNLDLSREQLKKLKDIKQDAKAKREAIQNDDVITDKEQKAKLKALRMETDEAIKKILTEEQWQKFIEYRKQKNGSYNKEEL